MSFSFVRLGVVSLLLTGFFSASAEACWRCHHHYWYSQRYGRVSGGGAAAGAAQQQPGTLPADADAPVGSEAQKQELAAGDLLGNLDKLGQIFKWFQSIQGKPVGDDAVPAPPDQTMQKINDLHARIDRINSRVSTLEGKVQTLEQGNDVQRKLDEILRRLPPQG